MIWFRKAQSIFSHFVKRDTLHLSKTVSGFFGQYNYNIDNKTMYCFAKNFSFNKINQREIYQVPRSSWKHNDHSAPTPPLVQNHAKHDEDGGDIDGKNISGQLGLVCIDSMHGQ
jgi:hypothetical protein